MSYLFNNFYYKDDSWNSHYYYFHNVFQTALFGNAGHIAYMGGKRGMLTGF
jgi:hypothetical protein